MNALVISLRWRILLSVLGAVLLARGALAADTPEPAKKEAVSSERVETLIRQLGDKDYFRRQQAQEELARLGFEVFDAVSAATNDDDLEIASRAKHLLQLMRVEWTAESDPPKVKEYLHDYESANPAAREERIEALAELPNGQGVPALCRLVRFEKLPSLSRTAAIALLRSQASAEPPGAATIATVHKILDGCKRPGAVWLLAWTRLGREPEAVMAEWSKLVDDEQAVLREAPLETDADVVAGLIRFQVVRLRKLGKTDEAMAVARRLVDITPGDLDSLTDLLEWLVEQKTWKAVDDLAQRFALQVVGDSGLLYRLAEAYDQQGQKDLSEETAGRAFRLNPGKDEMPLLRHLDEAKYLQERGYMAWARRELEHVMAEGEPDQNGLVAASGARLAELLHDQGEDFKAGSAMEKALGALDRMKDANGKPQESDLKELRSRMHYYFACHWEGKNDRVKQREALDKAIEINPSDIDVLIACYRLPDQSAEYRAKVTASIQRTAAALHDEVVKNAADPSPRNNLAWLIANTEGDLDQALKYAEKAVELSPKEGGFVDTLARVHYAKGDVEGAVKLQTKAVGMLPHSGLIQRQLDFFRRQLEEKKKP